MIRVLLAVNVALAVAIAVSWPSDAVDAGPRFTLPALASVERIEIRRTGERDVTLARAQGGWMADGAPIDPYALADLEAVMAEPVGVDQAVAADALERYGVGEHALTVTLHGAGEAQAVRVGKGLDGRRTFIWPVGGEQVFRARADLRRAFDRPAAHWRERRLFARQASELAVMRRVVGERVEWVARREGPEARWVLTAPTGGEQGAIEAGQDELDAVANTFATARADDFTGGVGFAVVATLHGETFGGEVFALELGPVADDGSRPGRVAGQAAVAHLPRHLAIFLGATADDLRERRVFEVSGPDGVEEVAIGGRSPVRLVREGRGWRMSSPTAQPVSTVAVEGWLSGLLGVKAAGFVDAPPDDAFSPVVHRVALRLAGDAQVELEVGGVWQGKARFARTTARPERVVVLGASTVEALRPAPAVFVEGPRGEGPGQPR